MRVVRWRWEEEEPGASWRLEFKKYHGRLFSRQARGVGRRADSFLPCPLVRRVAHAFFSAFTSPNYLTTPINDLLNASNRVFASQNAIRTANTVFSARHMITISTWSLSFFSIPANASTYI